MKENRPSATAESVARRRAAHQIFDDPTVLCDPLALRIIDAKTAAAVQSDPQGLEQTPWSRYLRASVAARSRYAEDQLDIAVKRGVRQYVILGAGLDTFAYRNSYPEDTLHVFEVDHSATQAWKRARLDEGGIRVPCTLTFVPVDFETQAVERELRRAGFKANEPSFFSWLGVTHYLTIEAITDMLRFVASMPVESVIVFDYMIPPSLLSPISRQAYEALAHRVELAGEPFQSSFDPSSLEITLKAMGFGQIEDVGPTEINARYFSGRADGLKVGDGVHFMKAQV
ncbi:MAG: SAM-dependent methyltransferase [Desulfomonilaceae bacterium]